jgi:hypothetical protein
MELKYQVYLDSLQFILLIDYLMIIIIINTNLKNGKLPNYKITIGKEYEGLTWFAHCQLAP